MQKINFNKSIKDKEKKILEYYKKTNSKSNLDKPIPAKSIININYKKRTKKYIQKSTIQPTDDKLTKTAKLPLPESTKPKVVNMD